MNPSNLWRGPQFVTKTENSFYWSTVPVPCGKISNMKLLDTFLDSIES